MTTGSWKPLRGRNGRHHGSVTTHAREKKERFMLWCAVILILKGTMATLSWKWHVHPRKKFNMSKHMRQLTGQQFLRMYRMNVESFMKLKIVIEPLCTRQQRVQCTHAPAVSVDVMLCVSLRLLAGASYLDVSWPYGIGVSTVYEIFEQTIDALDQSLRNIQFPTTESACTNEAQKFCDLRKTPIVGIIGALDGIAIAIQQPRLNDAPDARKYFNRKGFFALVVQAVASADYKFTFVSAKHAGSTHDSTAFQATKLYAHISRGRLPSWANIVCDDAYANEPHMLTPYSGKRLTTRQDSYNYYQSSCRIVVEQTFGILVNRWGILWSPLRCNLMKATSIVVICCKLHNFIMDTDDDDKFNTIPTHHLNNVHGEALVHLQDFNHSEPWIGRGRQRCRENNAVREGVADSLQELGFVRRR